MCLWLNRDNHDPIEDGYVVYLDLVKGKRKKWWNELDSRPQDFRGRSQLSGTILCIKKVAHKKLDLSWI